ncbi:hypothetical protein Glove_82g94 [Diversispora epigaea]|uniref:Serine-threonine/tyrosine-protein kinase catalytic domain-containing protein n=1 Tax=Diversispora epigaea TaxID=1348612 RepID=A0A397J8L1_9GLOM|nr:hypothetical protein Glove_82g94 [Diversispora epigaea]
MVSRTLRFTLDNTFGTLAKWFRLTKDPITNDYIDLAFFIANGYRSKFHEEIPQENVDLIKQCWDANLDNRPDVLTICEKKWNY